MDFVYSLLAEGTTPGERARLNALLAAPLEEDKEQAARIEKWKAVTGFR